MIESFRKIWRFAGNETKNINKSVAVGFLNAVLQMFQVAAIYFVVSALTEGEKGGKTAWLALAFELVAVFGGVITVSISKMLQTHAGYFMAADRRISIADRLKSVPVGFFNQNSLGQLSGVCTTVIGGIEGMVPMVLVNILGGLISTAVFTIVILIFDWRIGLIVTAGILLYLCAVSAMGKKSVAIAENTQKSQTALVEAVLETIQGMSVIKSFNLMGKGDKKLKNALEYNCRSNQEVEQVLTPYVRDYTLESLMDQISVVFQNVYLFADTIENNIKFGSPNATHEQVVNAAKAACCDDFINSLPNGYDTVIGEGGSSLSGGEKQRISIARAMLKNAPIVILDEATANVDPDNEDRLQKAVEALTRNKTIIIIAHRLKTVRHADKILVIDHGRIVQQGRHEELAAQPGIYADFICGKKETVDWKL